MSKYAVFFTLKAEAIARAMQQPSDRAAVTATSTLSLCLRVAFLRRAPAS